MVAPLSARLPRSGRGRRTGLTLLALVGTFVLGTAAPALAAPGPVPSPAQTPGVDIRNGSGGLTQPVTLVLLLGALSLLPGLLIMVTAFTRIVIVLGFTRSALGTQGVPPNQVIIGLAMFLTFFVMGPVFSQANHDAVQPFLKGKITQAQAYDKGIEPFRGFMLKQVREKDLQLFVDLSGKKAPKDPKDVPTSTLVPAYVISELRAAFLIGFVVFIPFIVIDLVVSAALSAMGMAMLPPSLISLPFKLLLFVAVDGWYLVVSSLVRSFH
ncbi:MAG: flagellar type III secretion system pore protein FliP [Mycobacteriales bacterium]